MKLNLGACDNFMADYINVDIVPHDGIFVADLSKDWPWPDNSVDEILAYDIIEHLPDKIHTMNEMWRVLKPNKEVKIRVPTTEGTGAFQDPTHVSFWNRRSFLYYTADNRYRERFANHYGIKASFQVNYEVTIVTQDGPVLNITLAAIKKDD